MLLEPVQVDQAELGLLRAGCIAARIEEEMTEIEILVKDAGAMEGGGDPGHFGDDPAFQVGEACAIERIWPGAAEAR